MRTTYAKAGLLLGLFLGTGCGGDHKGSSKDPPPAQGTPAALTDQKTCEAEGKIWDNNACKDKPQPTDQASCEAAGKVWENDVCKDKAAPGPQPDDGKALCEAAGKIWTNGVCTDAPPRICDIAGDFIRFRGVDAFYFSDPLVRAAQLKRLQDSKVCESDHRGGVFHRDDRDNERIYYTIITMDGLEAFDFNFIRGGLNTNTRAVDSLLALYARGGFDRHRGSLRANAIYFDQYKATYIPDNEQLIRAYLKLVEGKGFTTHRGSIRSDSIYFDEHKGTFLTDEVKLIDIFLNLVEKNGFANHRGSIRSDSIYIDENKSTFISDVDTLIKIYLEFVEKGGFAKHRGSIRDDAIYFGRHKGIFISDVEELATTYLDLIAGNGFGEHLGSIRNEDIFRGETRLDLRFNSRSELVKAYLNRVKNGSFNP